ncbi:hypothetical protein DMUE_5173 [Dictyocoela muelleri]|nr:hypothetical protein DMUE_5173 [Dictyocoela muelleri]
MAEKLAVDNFKASKGWIYCLKNKYNLKFKSLKGKSNYANHLDVTEFIKELKSLFKKYKKSISSIAMSHLYFTRYGLIKVSLVKKKHRFSPGLWTPLWKLKT